MLNRELGNAYARKSVEISFTQLKYTLKEITALKA